MQYFEHVNRITSRLNHRARGRCSTSDTKNHRFDKKPTKTIWTSTVTPLTCIFEVPRLNHCPYNTLLLLDFREFMECLPAITQKLLRNSYDRLLPHLSKFIHHSSKTAVYWQVKPYRLAWSQNICADFPRYKIRTLLNVHSLSYHSTLYKLRYRQCR